jgi:hypothetical protein
MASGFEALTSLVPTTLSAKPPPTQITAASTWTKSKNSYIQLPSYQLIRHYPAGLPP